MQGSLFIRPIEARLYRDVELFRKMDPYCRLTLGNQTVKGTICKKGGKRPLWDDIFVFGKNEPTYVLEVMEKGTLTADHTIGVCEIDLQEVEEEGNVLKWYELHYKKKLAGEILLETIFVREQESPKTPLVYVGRKLVEKEIVTGHLAQKVAAKHLISYQEKNYRKGKGGLLNVPKPSENNSVL